MSSSTLKKDYKTAFDAIERIASAPGVQPGDRAVQLGQLRNRVSDHIVRLSEEAIARKTKEQAAQEGEG
ncbi:MAG: hypothetical protein NVV60_01605 [Luteimonas sp.]|nr:hypothetical protein [Luteimonas sp.]